MNIFQHIQKIFQGYARCNICGTYTKETLNVIHFVETGILLCNYCNNLFGKELQQFFDKR